MKYVLPLFFILLTASGMAQSGSVNGMLADSEENAVPFANVMLYNAADSSLAKANASMEDGSFTIAPVDAGSYFLVATFIGTGEVRKDGISVANAAVDVGTLTFNSDAVQLEAAAVTAQRPLVEVKPDRTVFNVEGTVNSVGDNAFTLMRKAPGVTVDNNDNINLLGRSGVMVYIDGKRLPLGGEDLANYLKNIPSDQIDRIDLISNPGAKYDAEGNAGIIDIRLKKDKSLGANGSARATVTRGQKTRYNGSLSGNYRNKTMNVFGTLGGSGGGSFNNIDFRNWQNGLEMYETNYIGRDWQNANLRLGSDFYLADKHIIGFLVSGNNTTADVGIDNSIELAQNGAEAIDSILVANSVSENERMNAAYNLNYRYDDREKGRSFNVDLDYGQYNSEQYRTLPNVYFDPDMQTVLTEVNNWFDTPSDITITTGRLDYEDKLFGGVIGVGTKYSNVFSDNSFLVFDEIDGSPGQNDTLSNIFEYDETVYAAYVEYKRPINDKINFSGGVRAEYTDLVGNLEAFLPELVEPPVKQDYLQWFPSAGLTWQVKPMHALSLNYSRRINRPDYEVLNPFNNQLSQLSFEKGNPRLQPEIVNNAEIGYTLQYRFNFKLAYSKTVDQITRLIGPDDVDPRASFITWDNLASQEIWSFNASLPFQPRPKWSAYFNLSASHLDNQADYGENGSVDIQAFTYNIYTQHTIELPGGFKGEISGWFSGPGVWGGVFLYDESWSLNLGLQKTFMNDALNVRLAANDIFYESYWSGYSDFNGLYGEGEGNWDSRWVSLSVGYTFGNQNVKSRRRDTGLEKEAGRVGGD